MNNAPCDFRNSGVTFKSLIYGNIWKSISQETKYEMGSIQENRKHIQGKEALFWRCTRSAPPKSKCCTSLFALKIKVRTPLLSQPWRRSVSSFSHGFPLPPAGDSVLFCEDTPSSCLLRISSHQLSTYASIMTMMFNLVGSLLFSNPNKNITSGDDQTRSSWLKYCSNFTERWNKI